jgi:hypothetical protein
MSLRDDLAAGAATTKGSRILSERASGERPAETSPIYLPGDPRLRSTTSVTPAALTVYRLTTDAYVTQLLFGADDVIVLGRDAAFAQSAELMDRPDVLSVTCAPLVWDSQAERDAVSKAYFNGMDLGAPLLSLAEAVGLDVDPENFDPVALLSALRAAP